MNVLSLFDGMSCGQIAMQRCGIKVSNYYASEIDKHAIAVTKANFPNTKHLGDVRFVDVSQLEKIDLLIGGSPCQSFSFAGKRKGMSTVDNIEILSLEHYLELKQQNFEFQGQSYLFWEYMRILTEIRKYNPDVKFLLENVLMSEKWEKVLTKSIGIAPIMINSALVSAQSRKRLYWTNIGAHPDGFFGDIVCKIPQPKDKNLLLKHILEENVDQKYFLSKKMITGLKVHTQRMIERGNGFCFEPNVGNEQAKYVIANCFKMGPDDNYIVAQRGRDPEDLSNRKKGAKLEQTLEPRLDGKTNCLTTVQKDNLVLQINPSKESNGCQPFQQNRVYDAEGISPALQAQLSSGAHNIKINDSIRRLTPTECERLQTVPDGYTAHVSDTQRYRMLGNGWTVDVIAHIFNYLNK